MQDRSPRCTDSEREQAIIHQRLELKGNIMRLIIKKSGIEIWAQFDHAAQVYELFFDNKGQAYTGWAVDSIKDALVASTYIIQEQLS
jgi:hypothetical protein